MSCRLSVVEPDCIRFDKFCAKGRSAGYVRAGLFTYVAGGIVAALTLLAGNRFTRAHAVKNGKRYRYYVSQKAIKNPGIEAAGPIRIPAAEIEDLVCARLAAFLASALDVIGAMGSGESAEAATSATGGGVRFVAQGLVLKFITSVSAAAEVATAKIT